MGRDKLVWLATLGAALVALLVVGTRYSFGIYLRPMTAELGWGREVFGFAVAIQIVLVGAGAPLFGLISDKLGAGMVLVGGTAVYALGLFWTSQAASPLELTFSLGVLVGLGLSATSVVILIGAVGRLVSDKRRTLAMGMVTAGASAGQVMVPPFGQSLLSAYGWSGALTVMAGMILLVFPLSLVFFAAGKPDRQKGPGLPVRQALAEAGSHSGFRFLTAGFFVCGAHASFVAVHLPAFVVDKGMDATVGATALMVLGFFNIIGSILWGQLGTRYSKKNLLSLLYLGRAVVFAIFFFVPMSPWSVLTFAGSLGFLWLGTVPLTSGLVGQIFGMQYLTMLFGFVYFSHQVGGFLGSWLGGYVYDRTGSYDFMWYASIALGIFSALVHLPIRELPVVHPGEAEPQTIPLVGS